MNLNQQNYHIALDEFLYASLDIMLIRHVKISESAESNTEVTLPSSLISSSYKVEIDHCGHCLTPLRTESNCRLRSQNKKVNSNVNHSRSRIWCIFHTVLLITSAVLLALLCAHQWMMRQQLQIIENDCRTKSNSSQNDFQSWVYQQMKSPFNITHLVGNLS